MEEKKIKKSTIDSFKIKILKNGTHYILSRYNIFKQLILIQIDSNDALKISKELKKFLYNKNISEIKEEAMYNNLFEILKIFNYKNYIDIFVKTAKFNQQKVPILFLVGGNSLSLRSSFSTKLAENLNISNIISSDLITNFTEVLNPEDKSILMEDKNLKEQLCIRRGSNMDILKCCSDGKPLLIEGNINFDLFLKSKKKNKYKNSLLEFDKFKFEDEEKLNILNEKNYINLFNEKSDFIKSLKINLNYLENKNEFHEAELILWKKLKELKNKNVLIIPIYLFINKQNHYELIKNYANKHYFKKYNIDYENEKKNKHKKLLKKLNEMKYNDIKNDKCLFLPIDCFQFFDKSINEIHSYFLKQIESLLYNN